MKEQLNTLEILGNLEKKMLNKRDMKEYFNDESAKITDDDEKKQRYDRASLNYYYQELMIKEIIDELLELAIK